MKKSFSLRKSCMLLMAGFLAISGIKAQQVPFYTHYYINPFIYNPSYAGTTSLWNAYAIHHAQWAGFPGAPVTTAATIEGPIKSKKVGLGLTLLNDVTGITSNIGISTSYSYRADLGRNHLLYFGISLGVMNKNIDFSRLNDNNGNGNVVTDISTTDESSTSFDGSFGINYNWNGLNLGFAVPQVLNKFSSSIDEQNPRSDPFAKNYLGTIKYNFYINKEKEIIAYPLVMVRAYPNAPFQYDLNAVLDWKRYGWFAVSYKNDYAITLNLGLRYNNISFGYAQDLITNSIGAEAGVSSEFILGFSFGVTQRKEEDNAFIEERLNRLKVESNEDKKKIDSLESKLTERMDRIEKGSGRDNSGGRIENFSGGMDAGDVVVGNLYRLNSVNFGMKSTKLDSKSKQILNELVDFMNDNPSVKLEIHGHTDDVGEPENNMKLSEDRAKLIYDYLVEKGVEETRVAYKFFGESRPIMEGTSPKVRAMNRRTEILIVDK